MHIHRKTLCDWTLLASDWLAVIYREIPSEHWPSSYGQLDETPIRYLQPGSGKAQTGYLWVSNIPGGRVFFHWHDGRDTDGMTERFKQQTPTSEESLLDEKNLAN